MPYERNRWRKKLRALKQRVIEARPEYVSLRADLTAYRRRQPGNFWERLKKCYKPASTLVGGAMHRLGQEKEFGPLAEGYNGDAASDADDYKVLPALSFSFSSNVSQEEPVALAPAVSLGVAVSAASPTNSADPRTPVVVDKFMPHPDDELPDTGDFASGLQGLGANAWVSQDSPTVARLRRQAQDSPTDGSGAAIARDLQGPPRSFLNLSSTQSSPVRPPFLPRIEELRRTDGVMTSEPPFLPRGNVGVRPSIEVPRIKNAAIRPLTDHAPESYGPREGDRRVIVAARHIPVGPVQAMPDSKACKERREKALARYSELAREEKVQNRASAVVRLVKDVDPTWMRKFLWAHCKEVVPDTGCWLSVETPETDKRPAVDFSNVEHPTLKRGDGTPLTFRQVHITRFPRDPNRRTRSLTLALHRCALVAAGFGDLLVLTCEGKRRGKGESIKRTYDASHWCLNPFCFCPEHLFPELVRENIGRNDCRRRVEIRVKVDQTTFIKANPTSVNLCPHVNGEMAVRCKLPVLWVPLGEATFVRANGKIGHTYESHLETETSFESRQNESLFSASDIGTYRGYRSLLGSDFSVGSGEQPWAI